MPDTPLIQYYAARAAEYDQIYLKPGRPPVLRSIERWLAPKFQDARTLEVACGTGFWTQTLAQLSRGVVAIDAAAEMLEIADMRLPENKVKLLQGDVYQIPPELGRFNAAFAGFFFSHVPKARRQEFLAGLSKVLVPGAEVVLIDNLYIEGESTPIADKDADGNTYQTRVLQNGSTHRVLKNFPSEGELHQALGELGVRAKFQRWDYYWTFEYVAT